MIVVAPPPIGLSRADRAVSCVETLRSDFNALMADARVSERDIGHIVASAAVEAGWSEAEVKIALIILWDERLLKRKGVDLEPLFSPRHVPSLAVSGIRRHKAPAGSDTR
jgi:hypothetical protein